MRHAQIYLLLLSTVTSSLAAQQNRRPACEANNAGLTLPAGFCALTALDNVVGARHIVVAPNGDVYVAIQNQRRNNAAGARGAILALRDGNGDGKYDTRGVDSHSRFGVNGGNGIALRGNQLYFATDDAVLRYRLNPGQLVPSAAPDTIVRDLPTGGHTSKSIALGAGNALYVNIGSRTNSCQTQDRTTRSPGIDPCVELDTRAGIWQFDANKLNQQQRDGVRFGTGMRNMVAITTTADGSLYGAQHGRDQLSANWGFSNEYNAENPAEIAMRIRRGDDYGWPYCYYSNELKKQVLAPEYGGDGKQIARCAQKKAPLTAFPGHWAPNAIALYNGRQFPAKYRGGAFIAFHGSWNRAPLPQQGFNVTFTPAVKGQLANRYEVFADGFAPHKEGQQADHRPTGLAVGTDGSLFVTDDAGGRIYRIFYTGR